jgi:hypothetical protein
MRWNAVLALGVAIGLAGFLGLLAPESLTPQGTSEETAKALWLGALAFGVILMCIAPLLGPKRLYRAPKKHWSRFETGARPVSRRAFGLKGQAPVTFRDAPGSLHKTADVERPLALPPPK